MNIKLRSVGRSSWSLFNAQSRHLPRGTSGNHKDLTRYSLSVSKIQSGTSRRGNTNTNRSEPEVKFLQSVFVARSTAESYFLDILTILSYPHPLQLHFSEPVRYKHFHSLCFYRTSFLSVFSSKLLFFLCLLSSSLPPNLYLFSSFFPSRM
jgi:hypothetical protein